MVIFLPSRFELDGGLVRGGRCEFSARELAVKEWLVFRIQPHEAASELLLIAECEIPFHGGYYLIESAEEFDVHLPEHLTNFCSVWIRHDIFKIVRPVFPGIPSHELP